MQRLDYVLIGVVALIAALVGTGCNDAELVGFAVGAQQEEPGLPSNTPSVDPTPAATPIDPIDPSEGLPEGDAGCNTVMIRDLRIWSDDAEGPVVEYRPWAVIDLDDPDASVLNDLPIEPGVYSKVRFTLHKPVGHLSPGPGTGNPSENVSVHLCGIRDGVSWEYAGDVTDQVYRESDGGVMVTPYGPARLFVAFDKSTWFDGIDLTTAERDEDGVVRMSHDSNHALANRLEKNFKDSVSLTSQ